MYTLPKLRNRLDHKMKLKQTVSKTGDNDWKD